MYKNLIEYRFSLNFHIGIEFFQLVFNSYACDKFTWICVPVVLQDILIHLIKLCASNHIVCVCVPLPHFILLFMLTICLLIAVASSSNDMHIVFVISYSIVVRYASIFLDVAFRFFLK